MKRLLPWLAGLTALLLVGYVALWLTAPAHRISRASFDRVREGMTAEDLEEVFGLPAGRYRAGEEGSLFSAALIGRLPSAGSDVEEREWVGPEGGARVWLQAGRVRAAVWYEAPVRDFPHRLRRWLGITR